MQYHLSHLSHGMEERPSLMPDRAALLAAVNAWCDEQEARPDELDALILKPQLPPRKVNVNEGES